MTLKLLVILFIKLINIYLQMCMGPKCPCIYPPLPHKSLKYISFRERSPIDRNLIRNKLTNISKPLLTKIKY